MREVIIQEWCDYCWQDGEARVAATRTFTIGVADGEVPSPPLKLLQTCEPHSKDVSDLLTVLTQTAGLTDAPVTPAAPKPASVRKAPSQQPIECPGCGETKNGTSSLVTHIWAMHRGETRPASPTVCPDCGLEDTAKNVGQHRKLTHGYDQIAEAMTGIKPFKAKARTS